MLALLVAFGCGGGTGQQRPPSPTEPAPPAKQEQPLTRGSASLTPTTTGEAIEAPDDLVDVTELDDTLVVDMPYATAKNFTGVAVYPVARCLLRREVALRLVEVQKKLREDRVGLKLWDCYRPFSVQEKFWELVPDERYVAQPVRDGGTPVEGSKHNRGAAVDLTLIDADGKELAMPTRYDDFTRKAHRDYSGGSKVSRENRARLEEAMVAHGFEPLPTEWWHFDGPGWQNYPLADTPLQD